MSGAIRGYNYHNGQDGSIISLSKTTSLVCGVQWNKRMLIFYNTAVRELSWFSPLLPNVQQGFDFTEQGLFLVCFRKNNAEPECFLCEVIHALALPCLRRFSLINWCYFHPHLRHPWWRKLTHTFRPIQFYSLLKTDRYRSEICLWANNTQETNQRGWRGINKAFSSAQSGIEAQKGGVDRGESQLGYHSVHVVTRKQLCAVWTTYLQDWIWGWPPPCRWCCHLWPRHIAAVCVCRARGGRATVLRIQSEQQPQDTNIIRSLDGIQMRTVWLMTRQPWGNMQAKNKSAANAKALAECLHVNST